MQAPRQQMQQVRLPVRRRLAAAVLFLALLELIRLKRLKVRQAEAFGEILVIKVT